MQFWGSSIALFKRACLIAIEPRKQRVDPANGAAKPAIGAGGLAAEAQDELAKTVVAEWKSHVEKEDVSIATTVGIFDGMPHGELVGMQPGIALASEGSIPQIGLSLAVDHNRTANDAVAIFGDEESTGFAWQDSEEVVVGHIAFGLQPVVVAQQARKSQKLIVGRHLLSGHTLGIGILDVLVQTGAQSLFGCVRVKRVVNAHPAHGEKALLAKRLIAEHLLRQVAHFEVEHASAHLAVDGRQHGFEKLFAWIGTFGIDTFTVDAAVHIKIRWKPRRAIAHQCQQLGNDFAVGVLGGDEIGAMPGRLSAQIEKQPAGEQTARREFFGQFVGAAVDVGRKFAHQWQRYKRVANLTVVEGCLPLLFNFFYSKKREIPDSSIGKLPTLSYLCTY